MTGSGRRRERSVAGRLFAILEVFSEEGSGLTIAQIGRRTGIPISTLYRLLADLTGIGAIEKAPDGRYLVGLRLWEIVKLASRAERLVEIVSPAMHDLHDVARGSVALAVPAGGDALVVHVIGGHHPVEAERAGTRIPLTSPGTGQVLLAHAPVDVVETALVDGAADGATAATGDLRGDLTEIRRVGVAVSRTSTGSLVIAAPVCGPAGHAVAAVALGVVPGTESRLAPLVRLTAKRLAREIAAAAAAGTTFFLTQ